MKEFVKKYSIYILFVICALMCIYRALKGFCWSDETFYISTADRFFKGDALIKQEWYRTQMSSVICLPFYALYVLITGSNAGIILYFRALYLILSFTTAYIAYRVIKKEYPVAVATVVSVMIMFYAHLNITSLSYYMLSLECLVIALLLIYDYKNTGSKKELVVAGAIFALSVLSLPSFAAMYFIVVVVVAIILIARRYVKLPREIVKLIDEQHLFVILLYSLIGIMIPAILFVIYMITKVSISEIISSVPYILIDNEHNYTYGYLIRKFYRSINDVYGRWAYIGYLLIGVSFVCQKWLKQKNVASIMALGDVILFIVYAYKSYGHTGYISTALCMLGLPLYFMSNKKNHRMFWLFGVGGMCLAMTYSISSSDFLYVLSIGHFITGIGCVIFAYDFITSTLLCGDDDVSADKMVKKLCKLAALMIALAVVYTCCVTIALRMGNVYRDAPMSRLTYKITYGPAKGLYTTDEHLRYYEDVISTLDEQLGDDTKHNVLFSKILPWGYMYIDDRCAYPTTWRATAYNEDQLSAYYETNPDRYPDVIVVLDEEYGSYDACGDVEDDHNPNLDEMNDYWKNYIRDNNMKKTDVSCGVIYKK